MFTEPTLLVVGAGASADVNMPIGTELARRIVSGAEAIRRGDSITAPPPLAQNYGADPADPTQVIRHLDAITAISQRLGFSRSIDLFIHENAHLPSVARIGKMLIAHEILRAERSSSLKTAMTPGSNYAIDLGQLRTTWYEDFAHQWLTRIPRNDVQTLAPQNLRIINFNYDRCLELFLVAYLAQRCGIPEETAIQIVEDMEIIHPYGVVGPLPGFAQPAASIPFGEFPMVTWEAADSLRTFTETTNSDVQQATRTTMQWARRVIFLGFSFQSSNVDLLRPNLPEPDLIGKSLFASVFGMEEPEQNEVRRQARRAAGQSSDTPVNIQSVNCKRFVELYGPTWR